MKFFDKIPNKVKLSPAIILILAGCSAPNLGPLKNIRNEISSYLSQGEEIKYPNQDWWKIYGDEQLNSLVEQGLRNSPSLVEAAARLEKANAAAKYAGATLYPTISGDASMQKMRQSYNNGVPSSFVPKGYNTSSRAVLNFSYELDFWGRNSAQRKAAIFDNNSARYQEQQARIMLSTSIVSSYARLAQLYAELDEAIKVSKIRLKTADLNENRFKYGLENSSAVNQARSVYELAEADVENTIEQIELNKNEIVALIGGTPNQTEIIKRPNIKDLAQRVVVAKIPADLISHRPDVQMTREAVEAAAKRIHVAKTGYYPNVSLTGYFGRQSLGVSEFLKSTSTIGNFGPAIHLPIFEGGKIEANYVSSRADYDIAVSQYESSIITALKEVSNALTSIKSLDKRSKKIKAALKFSEKSYEISKRRYAQGLSSYFEVLNAEDVMVTSRRRMTEIQTRAMILDVSLVKALGGGFHDIENKTTTKGN